MTQRFYKMKSDVSCLTGRVGELVKTVAVKEFANGKFEDSVKTLQGNTKKCSLLL